MYFLSSFFLNILFLQLFNGALTFFLLILFLYGCKSIPYTPGILTGLVQIGT